MRKFLVLTFVLSAALPSVAQTETDALSNDNQSGYVDSTSISEDGQSGVVSASADQQILESPSLNERTEVFRDGQSWQTYNKDGISICATYLPVKDYGKYHQVHLYITNNSKYTLDVNPKAITATLVDKKGKQKALNILSVDEYLKKVDHDQYWEEWDYGWTQDHEARAAGTTTSTTYSSANEHVHANGGGPGRGPRDAGAHENMVSTTTSVNGTIVAEAQEVADKNKAAYNEGLAEDRAEKKADYLKRTTLYPGKSISGFINIEQKKGASLNVNVDISGINYFFNWDISQ